MRALFYLTLLLLAGKIPAQNTLLGEARRVPEAEVTRQSAFVDAQRERLLGHHQKAVALFTRFTRENPSIAAGWHGLAQALEASKEGGTALSAAAKARSLEPENVWFSDYYAELLEKAGRGADALAIVQQLSDKHPENEDYLERVAYLSVLCGEPQKALKALDKLEKRTGLNEGIATRKQTIYSAMGDQKKAAAELRRLADAYPSNPAYRHRLAQLYETQGDADNARKTYEDLLRRFPDDPVARLAVVEKSKRSSEATFIESLLPLFSDPGVDLDAKIRQVLPYFEALDKQSDPALTDALLRLGTAVESAHPRDAKAWSLSGDLLFHANRPTEALPKYRKCLELNPTVFSVWENILQIQASQGNYDELLKTAEKAVDAFPNQAKGYYYYGVAANQKGRPSDALDMLDQAALMAATMPLRFDIADQYGLALVLKKDTAGAIAYFQTWLSKGGDKHPGLLEHYGDALFQNADRAGAVQQWEKARSLRPSEALDKKIAAAKP